MPALAEETPRIEDLVFENDAPKVSDLVFDDTPRIEDLVFEEPKASLSPALPQGKEMGPFRRVLDEHFNAQENPVQPKPESSADEIAGRFTQEMPIVVPQEAGTDEPIISEQTILKGIKALRTGSPIDNEYSRGAEKSLAKMASGMTTTEGGLGIALAPFMPALVGSYFAVKGTESLYELAKQSKSDWDTLTKEQKGERVGDMVLSGAIPLAVLLHTGAEAKIGIEKIQRAQNISRIRSERAVEDVPLPPVLSDAVAKIEADAGQSISRDLTGPPGAAGAEPTKGVEPNATTERPSGQIQEGNLGEHTPGDASGKITQAVDSNSNAAGGQVQAQIPQETQVVERLQAAIEKRGIINADAADQAGIGMPEGYQEGVLGGQRLYVPSETAGGGVHGVIDPQGQFHAFDESAGTLEAPAQPAQPEPSKVVEFPKQEPSKLAKNFIARKPKEDFGDLIQHLYDSGITIRSKKGARKGSEGFYSEAYKQAIKEPLLRKLFRTGTGTMPDALVEDLRRSKRMHGDASVDDLWDRLLADAAGRRALAEEKKSGKTQAAEGEVEQTDFENVTAGQRPETGKPTTAMAVNDLLIGDEFDLDGAKAKVTDLETDPETGELSAVVIEDGKRFGVKRIGANEVIHLDQGTYSASPVEFVPKETAQPKATPKLRPMENQGDLLGGQTEDFAIGTETAVDHERIAKEKAAKEAALKESSKGQQEFIPMGGDVLVGLQPHYPSSGPTSIKNARVDVERANRGLPPAVEPARRSFGTVWDEAMGIVDRDPEAQTRLINSLRDNPRSLTDTEDALLLQRQIDLQNEYAKATRDLAQAFDDGREEAVSAEKGRVASLSDQLLDIYNIGKKAGTETGRGLNARKMMANDDFTLAQMTVEKRAANEGRPLSDKQAKEVQDLHAQIAKTQAAYDEYVSKTNERIAKLETDRALAEAKAKPEFSPGIISKAEELVKKFKESDAVKAARARLKGKVLSPTPQDIIDVALIAATHIAEGAVKSAQLTAQLISEFGEGIRPFIDEIYAKADKFHENFLKSLGTDAPTVKKALSAKATLEDRVSDAVTEIGAKFEKGERQAIHAQVNKIVRAMVEAEPKIARETLVDRVHEILKLFDPEITRLETMDAISGRGIFSLPSQDQVSKTVRDLKQQVRLVGHQQDVIAKKPLPRTGPQRDVMSDAARAEQQKLNDLKRQYGVTVTDPTKQLGSALQARKTYYSHRIADLKAEIKAGEKKIKNKAASPTDPALEAMKAEYSKLKAEHDSIFGKPELTDAQRVERAKTGVEREISEYERRIKEGDVAEKKSKTANTKELEALRARRDALREQWKELRDADEGYQRDQEAKGLEQKKAALEKAIAEKTEKIKTGDIGAKGTPVNRPLPKELEPLRQQLDALNNKLSELRKGPRKTPEEVALQALKTRLANRTAELLEKTAKGDFSVKTRKPIVLDAEATRLHFENAKAKAAWMEGLFKDRMANRTVPQKLLGGAFEAVNTSRALITSLDLSAVLRQGGFIAFGHPIRALKAFPAMFRALKSAEGQHAVNLEIMGRENFPRYQRSKLYLSMPETGAKLSQMEEAYMSRWAEKIPLVAHSQRAYITFLNKLRADSFDAMMNTLSRDGTFTDVEGKAVANFINVATGRGNLGMKENALVGLNSIFFAPRYAASRFQLLGGQPFYRGTAATRLAIAKEYGRFMVGAALVYGLAKLDGADVEDDPRSSDFGKLRYGNTRVDPMMGLIQTSVLLARLGSGETKNAKGKILPIRGNVKYGQRNAADVMATFLRSKLAPVPSAAVDVLAGKNVVGDPVTIASEAQNLLVPLTFQDIYKEMQEQGIARGTAFAMLSILGMGLQQYDAHKRPKP